jgi:hypothetical protein
MITESFVEAVPLEVDRMAFVSVQVGPEVRDDRVRKVCISEQPQAPCHRFPAVELDIEKERGRSGCRVNLAE